MKKLPEGINGNKKAIINKNEQNFIFSNLKSLWLNINLTILNIIRKYPIKPKSDKISKCIWWGWVLPAKILLKIYFSL